MKIVTIAVAATAALGLLTAASAQTNGMTPTKSSAVSGGGKARAAMKGRARTGHASSGYNQVNGKYSGAASGGAMSGSGSGGSTTPTANTSSGVMSH